MPCGPAALLPAHSGASTRGQWSSQCPGRVPVVIRLSALLCSDAVLSPPPSTTQCTVPYVLCTMYWVTAGTWPAVQQRPQPQVPPVWLCSVCSPGQSPAKSQPNRASTAAPLVREPPPGRVCLRRSSHVIVSSLVVGPLQPPPQHHHHTAATTTTTTTTTIAITAAPQLSSPVLDSSPPISPSPAPPLIFPKRPSHGLPACR